MKKSSFRRLTPKEFDAALLEKLTREGRVFINEPRVRDKNAYKGEILEYVKAINEFVSLSWAGDIDALWQEIVDSKELADFLTMKKGLHVGHMNRYAVTNLVGRMQSKAIYRKDLPMLSLHLKLEKVKKKNKYYTSSGNYTLSSEARQVLKKLFSRV